jgi:hypothetical protein
VWLICENWNCRISPGAALMSFGVKTRDLLSTGEPTTIVITLADVAPPPVMGAAVGVLFEVSFALIGDDPESLPLPPLPPLPPISTPSAWSPRKSAYGQAGVSRSAVPCVAP